MPAVVYARKSLCNFPLQMVINPKEKSTTPGLLLDRVQVKHSQTLDVVFSPVSVLRPESQTDLGFELCGHFERK